MATLYTDHNVAISIATLLTSKGHQVTIARDLGLERATDEMQLLTALERGAILITANRKDFEMLHRAWVSWSILRPHAGIIIFDQRGQPAAVAESIDTLLSGSPQMVNTLRRWSSNRWQEYANHQGDWQYL